MTVDFGDGTVEDLGLLPAGRTTIVLSHPYRASNSYSLTVLLVGDSRSDRLTASISVFVR
jgi:hypothetical protein